MYRQIKMELKNCINQMELKFIFSILWCISIGGFIINCFMYKNSYYQFLRAANENFILVSTSTRAIIIVLALFFPLLAMRIYSGSFKKEERSNLTQLIILRTSKKRYIWSKAIAIFIITFLSFLIPLLINQLLCYLTFPIEGFDNRWALPNYDLIRRYENTDLFDFFRIQYPFIYNLLYILIYSTLGGIIALLAYGVNFVQKFKSIKELQVNIIIFVIFMLSSFSSQILKIPIMDFLSYTPAGKKAHFIGLVLYCLFIFICAITLIIRGCGKYEEKN